MECVTCKSARVSRFLDSFGSPRFFCRNCWVSFPEAAMASIDPKRSVYTNFAAVGRIDSH